MPAFKNTDDLNRIMLALWDKISEDERIVKQLTDSKLIISFYYKDPESKITVDCSDGKELKVIVGDTDLKPEVEMSMKSDLAHDFWMGKVNIPLAIISGKISAKGPVHRALALLPVIKPAYEFYPDIYRGMAV